MPADIKKCLGSDKGLIKHFSGKVVFFSLVVLIFSSFIYLTGGQFGLTDEVEASPGDEVTIPDDNLREVILDKLQKSPGDTITVEDMEGMEKLIAAREDIEDLSGMEYAVNLKVLSLLENDINNISPLSGLDNLVNLRLGNNDINDISPLSGLESLEKLYLGSNDFNDLSPLSNLENLEWLNLWDNELSDIAPLSGLVNLGALYLDRNDISDLTPLSELGDLERLWLHHNNIGDISPLTGLESLKELYIWNNEISDISPLSGLGSLVRLGLQHNDISDISPLLGLNDLLWINLRYNFIDLARSGESMEIIKELDVKVGADVDYKPQKMIVHPGLEIIRIAGVHRFETAMKISRKGFPAYTDTVVLARGDDFPDALAGAPLAYARDCPLLLTRSDELPEETIGELERLLTEGDTVIILGETAAVSEEVEEQLDEMGYEVDRLGGISRFETAVEIANELVDNSPDEVFLTTGLAFADAVSGSSPAALHGSPILLTRPGELPEVTESYLNDHAENINDIQVLGGEAAVSEDVFNVVEGIGDAHRIYGINRWETATAIAEEFFGDLETATLATGLEFPDALCGGVFAALNEAPVLLTARDELPVDVETYFRGQERLLTLYVFGGEAAIADGVLRDIENIYK